MAQPESCRPSPEELLGRYHRAIFDASADDLAELYAAEAVHEFPFLFPGMPVRLEGREQVRAAYRAAWGAGSVKLEEIRNVVVHQTADPEVIVVEQETVGSVTTTSRPLVAASVLVMRARDGLLLNVRDYLDALAINHALGRLKAVIDDLA